MLTHQSTTHSTGSQVHQQFCVEAIDITVGEEDDCPLPVALVQIVHEKDTTVPNAVCATLHSEVREACFKCDPPSDSRRISMCSIQHFLCTLLLLMTSCAAGGVNPPVSLRPLCVVANASLSRCLRSGSHRWYSLHVALVQVTFVIRAFALRAYAYSRF
jgi:hypothetical protein